MKQLTKSAFNKAAAYIKQKARPLEKARFAYYFEGGSSANILTHLANFQNDDGGFGHGLESDIRLQDSSVIATTIAFQHFRALDTPADHPMVEKACAYLLKTYDAKYINWPIIPPNVDDAPHAPWWTYTNDISERLANPRAEIAGYLQDYYENFPPEVREAVIEAAIAYLLEHPLDMEIHDLQCYLRLWQTEALPPDDRYDMLAKLKPIAEKAVDTDPASWQAYGLQPVSIVTTPTSPFAEMFEDAIEENLDFIIDTQNADGSWKPSWSWAEVAPDAWIQAEQELCGLVTLGNLRVLHAFGRF